MKTQARAQPCPKCPYRQDVPSGVWSATDYAKLPPYDAETFNQPVATFKCHATPEFNCHGWVVVHMNRGHDRELLALRLHPCEIPEATVPLFASGAEAAAHGMRDLKRMSREARAAQAYLLTRHPRLEEQRQAALKEKRRRRKKKGTIVATTPQYLDPDCPNVQAESRALLGDGGHVGLALGNFSVSHVPTCPRCQAYGAQIEQSLAEKTATDNG